MFSLLWIIPFTWCIRPCWGFSRRSKKALVNSEYLTPPSPTARLSTFAFKDGLDIARPLRSQVLWLTFLAWIKRPWRLPAIFLWSVFSQRTGKGRLCFPHTCRASIPVPFYAAAHNQAAAESLWGPRRLCAGISHRTNNAVSCFLRLHYDRGLYCLVSLIVRSVHVLHTGSVFSLENLWFGVRNHMFIWSHSYPGMLCYNLETRASAMTRHLFNNLAKSQ